MFLKRGLDVIACATDGNCCLLLLFLKLTNLCRVSHFIFLRESRFYGSGVLAKV